MCLKVRLAGPTTSKDYTLHVGDDGLLLCSDDGVFGKVTVAKDDRLPVPVAVVRIFDVKGTPLEVSSSPPASSEGEGGHRKI